MKKYVLPIVAGLALLVSCEFNQSVKKDLITGISSKGDGLGVDNVNLTVGGEKVKSTSFIYGEQFALNFENILGFEKTEDISFPGMKFLVVSEEGDTVMRNEDLYANNEAGVNFSPLLLRAKITCADPIHSVKNYELFVHIWDKKGDGTFDTSMKFDVVPNPNILVESINVTLDEIYLFAASQSLVITGNEGKLNEEIYAIFEGLDGFTEQDGMIYAGLSMKATGSDGTVIMDEKDLIGKDGMKAADFQQQLAPNFTFSNSSGPIDCEVVIWDKKSESRIKATFSLYLE